MKKVFLKTALLALAAVGILSISSCEKGEDNNNPAGNNRLTLGEVGSVWQCSTEHYTTTWTLLNDSTIYSEVEKDSGYYAGFGDNVWYNYCIGDATDFGWLPEGLMLVFTKMTNSNNETYVAGLQYRLNMAENSFTIYRVGDRPAKSADSYLFRKIK